MTPIQNIRELVNACLVFELIYGQPPMKWPSIYSTAGVFLYQGHIRGPIAFPIKGGHALREFGDIGPLVKTFNWIPKECE